MKHFWATICKTVRAMLLDRCLSHMSGTLVYCGQRVGWIKMPLTMKVGLSPGHIVLDGNNPAPQKRGHSSPPHFLPHVYLWPNGRPSQQLLSSCDYTEDASVV